MFFRISFMFVFLLSIFKLLAIQQTSFDFFGDEAQYWIWSQKLDFGYYSKPPLLAWIISFFEFGIGNSFESLKVIPFIFYILTSYIIYLLIIELFGSKNMALISAITFYLLPSVSVSSFLLSTDVILIFFWSLCLLFLLRIRKNPNLLNFLLLGIFLGLGFMSKYAAIYFVLSLVILIVVDRKIYLAFSKNISFVLVFIFTVLLIIFPNILWNMNNGWVTIEHTSDNAGLNRIKLNFFQGLEFLVTQCIMLGPIIALSSIFFLNKININFENKFLLSFSLPIFIIVLVESILVRANANWAAVALVSLFIFLFNIVYSNTKKVIFINNIVNFIFCLIFLFLISSSAEIKFFNRINGISNFAKEIENKHLLGEEFLVIDDRLLYSNLRYLYRKNDINILMPHNPIKKINNHFQISDSLNKNFKKKFVYIGNPNNIDYLEKKFNIKKIDVIDIVFKNYPLEIYEVSF